MTCFANLFATVACGRGVSASVFTKQNVGPGRFAETSRGRARSRSCEQSLLYQVADGVLGIRGGVAMTTDQI